MTKYHVEVCVASARGLRRTFFRSQWFAVAWIDPKLKYCTGIDARGTTTPVWNTKFSATVDDADATLHVQVFSRESLFLRERLEGAVRIHLRGFLGKLDEGGSPAGVFPAAAEGLIVESGSFQLRKKHSQKPRGFVDVSIRISDRPDVESWAPRQAGTGGVFNGMSVSISGGNEIVSSDDHVNPSHPESFPPPPSQGKLGCYSHSHFVPNNAPNFPQNDEPHLPPDNARPTAPPPPPPPSNTGFLLPFFEPSSGQRNATYLSMPPSTSAAGRGRQVPAFGAAAAGSAMAAGAFLFGDDFLNAMDYTSSLDDGSVVISGNPLL